LIQQGVGPVGCGFLQSLDFSTLVLSIMPVTYSSSSSSYLKHLSAG
jgi:hypothetical protein